ncbi:MAG: PD40 domain-containing protein [Gemmatimonadaceae bacterium]|nr:PD40 domain-containing protein [Gemmatimonadaceae bacterium]
MPRVPDTLAFAPALKRAPISTLRRCARPAAMWCAGVVLALLSVPQVAVAQQGISIGLSRRDARLGLLVLPAVGAAGDSIAAIISRDLDYSDRYQMIATSSVSGPVATPTTGPNYPLYAKLGADGVVQGTVLPSGWLRVALHDVGKAAITFTKDFPLPTSANSPAWRMAVHGVSDAVVEWISGQRGIARTRIAFERSGRVWTVDSDGANMVPVTPSGMSPQWTPSGQGLVYSILDGARSPVMYTDLSTGAQRVVVAAPQTEGMSPAVSPDGRTVVFARVSESGTDLYAVPFEGGPARRITNGQGRASAQPAFSPDGQRLVFMSDRSGRSDVYISDVDGTDVEPLNGAVFGDKNDRTGPDWSPDGRMVAYQSFNGNSKQIMTMRLSDNSVRAVATDGNNDDPSWAPDARHLVFTSNRSGVRQLWVVDVETGRTRQLTKGSASRLAAWSPRLTFP